MKITKTYLSGCTWCNARGFVPNPDMGISTSTTIICPVCNGAKTIVVTETISDESGIKEEEENKKWHKHIDRS